MEVTTTTTAAKGAIELQWFCPACEEYKSADLFLSEGVDGYSKIHICSACWGKFTPFERMVLFLLARPTFEGGLSPKTQLDAIERLLEGTK